MGQNEEEEKYERACGIIKIDVSRSIDGKEHIREGVLEFDEKISRVRERDCPSINTNSRSNQKNVRGSRVCKEV